MITSAQIKKIHTLKTVLHLDDELYVEMLMSFGVQSSKKLTCAEANIFIDILEEKAAWTNQWKKRNNKYEELSNRYNSKEVAMATPPQLRMIEAIWREICYVDTDEFAKQSLRKFLQNKFKISDIKFLTKNVAVRVIRAILQIKQNIKGSKLPLVK